MTTMAQTEPPLKRLFDRLDFAPQPKRLELDLLHERWEAARAGAVAPRRSAIRFAPEERDAAETLFVHQFEGPDDDGVLTEGASAAAMLLGPYRIGDRLSKAGNRRGAVRLRRLFKEVRRTGQPVLAQYTSAERGRDRAIVEILVAPLSEDGSTIDSALTAISAHVLDGAPRRATRETAESSLALFALGASISVGEDVAQALGAELAPLEDREFEDGEYKIRPLENVRGRDCYIVFTLNGDHIASSADKLCKLLFFVGALKDAGAQRVTAVTPYLCFARKDRRTKPRDPVTTRYVAQLFEALGTDRVVCVDVHNIAAFQNAFRCETVHLDAQALFARHVVANIGDGPVAVVSPDLGGEKRAELFRLRLERMLKRPVAKAFMDKYRSEGHVVGDIFAGDVKDRTAIIIDDLIAGGGTVARTAAACRANGAARVWVAATHGVFSEKAASALKNAPIDQLIITDSVRLQPSMAAALGDRLIVISVAGLLAEAIRRLHANGSITQLLEDGP
ncbi:ribose-phosphate pyrophosphokinase [Methylocystis sp. H4A]|uniref:ribose-phosphate diphosphokinase n=1 Tax=Methylocystis sp. H4A TaxID=2785788 RepID=UPI0018C1F8CA|nr:ribose-phosphate diphosphokinase [Methylocystis sp. H4A]MBG0803159.1 ribose-phosphate pyrophosphokinase [Methylocystis sp. H4A]